jgi:putative pyruvate formate lyase activating enzyme
VFFGKCTMACVYCQNYPWSQEGAGTVHSTAELAAMLASLHRAGCHNWNLVSPTPWLPWVAEAAGGLTKSGVSLPFVYNTSGYERIETLEAYAGLADVYLTDLRYSDPATAAEGSGAPAYVETARNALKWMWQARGPLRVNGDGVAVSGVICRVLVLPEREHEAAENLRWIAGTMGTEVAVSLMAQYTPAYKASSMPRWNGRPSEKAYEAVRRELEGLGFENGWVQEYEADTPDELIGYRMQAGGSPAS